MRVEHINPHQKSHAIGLARQACARVFRDGGAPSDALEAFGLAAHGHVSDWSRAVDLIADALCSRASSQRAAA